MKSSILLTLFVFFAAVSLYAQDANSFPIEDDPIKIEMISEEEAIQPERPFWVALRINLDSHWHSYWKNPGDLGMPIHIEWELPEGFTAGPTEWPYPKRFENESIIGFGYEGETWFLTPITPPKSLDSQKDIEITASIRWLVCSDATCLPGQSQVSTMLPMTSQTPLVRQEWVSGFSKARSMLPKKQHSMQASRQNGLIRLHIDSSLDNISTFKEVDFFPEEKQSINVKSKATLTVSEENPSSYIIALADHAENKANTLKGIAVLSDGTNYEAIEVNTPIAAGHEEILSIADNVPLEDPSPALAPSHEYEGGYALALLLAFVGGMILNLMPCVLPVLSFKIFSFVKMANQERSKTFKHGLAFSGGVIASFWFLAAILLALQAYGRVVGWGFQLQEPLFLAFLAGVLFIFGLSLFGIFELGTSLTAVASDAQAKKQTGLTGSFLSGVLATTVATPCTGPFLGTALGYAVTLSPLPAMLIFTSLGIGMAFPYIFLTAFPNLIRFLPKPGAWMETFKQVMGFFMLATVLWLLWVFGAQTNTLAISLLLVGLFILSIACWIYGKWGTPINSRMTRYITYFITIVLFSVATGFILNTQAQWVIALNANESNVASESTWEPYSEERIADLQKKGIPVFVDFTAKWCLICQVNHMILSTKEVSTKFDEKGVVRMKADWTKNDDGITKALRKFGRSGVPLYVLYGPDPSQMPVVLPQVLTPKIVLEHLEDMNAPVQKGIA